MPRRAALAAVSLLLAGCGSSSKAPPTAPDFALHDAAGHAVRLSDFRGRAVLLTFVYTHCPDVCPLMVARLHDALDRLGPAARRVRVVAVSVDPRGDTPAAVDRFVARHDMTGRMSYLIGSRAQLARVWRAYGIGVTGTPEQREVGHSALVLGIDARGRRRSLYAPAFKVSQIVHDVPGLAAA